jgi:DNA-binding winged helix-turn-helix (wHTH) protein
MESLITKEIIIGDTVVFIPATRKLKNTLTGDSVILHTPANYCLLNLLANRQKIMSKNELIKASWNNGAQIISDNTFYQMVFNLRQNLVKVGGDNIIITVPRRGLKINPEIPVKVIDAELQEQTQATDNVPKFTYFLTEASSTCYRRNISLIILTVALLFLSYFLYTSETDVPVFSSYQYQVYNMCDVLYNDEIGKENVDALIIKYSIDCSQKRHITLTENENHSRLSVISCPAGTLTTKACSLSLYVK